MGDTIESLEIIEMGGGNTKTPPSNPLPKQTLQYKHLIFVWNNYSRDDIPTLVSVLDSLCFMYCFQQEVGTQGTPHLQGVISLHKRARWSEFGLPKCIHWEKCEHLSRAYLYSSALEWEGKKKRYGEIWTKNYTPPKPLKLLTSDQLFSWQTDIIERIKQEPNDRDIIWIWSRKGKMGKSSFCKLLVARYSAILCGTGKFADIMNLIFKTDMDKHNLIVFNLPRNNGNKISYSALEAMKDGLVCNTKFETGSKIFNAPHIIVFANKEPEYAKMSSDRWTVLNVDNYEEYEQPLETMEEEIEEEVEIEDEGSR